MILRERRIEELWLKEKLNKNLRLFINYESRDLFEGFGFYNYNNYLLIYTIILNQKQNQFFIILIVNNFE